MPNPSKTQRSSRDVATLFSDCLNCGTYSQHVVSVHVENERPGGQWTRKWTATTCERCDHVQLFGAGT